MSLPALPVALAAAMKLPSTAAIRDRLLPIALAQGIGLLCGIAGVKIATRLIAPDDYGAYGVYLSFTPLGMWVVHAGLIKFVARHWAASTDRAGLLNEVARAASRKLPWLALATGIAAAAILPTGWFWVWPLLFVTAAALAFATIAQTALQAMRAHWADCAVSTLGSVTRSFAPPLLYAAAAGSLAALHAGFGLHALVLVGAGALSLHTHLRRKPTSASPAAPQLSAVYDGSLFIALALAGWAVTAVNRWIAAGFFGAAYAGYFTLATNLTIVVTGMLGVVFMQYFQPALFAAPSATADERAALARRIDRLAAAYAGLSLAGVLALHVLAPRLVGILIGENYRASLALIVPVGAFGTALITAQFFHIMLLAGKRERACGPVDFGAAAVLALGGLIAAAVGGEPWFLRWLMISPLVPWLLNRPLARRFLFKPDAVRS